jgi:MiaB-like tRNA modifying enzyme
MVSVYLETYGCTLNHADSDILSGELERAGFSLSASADKADVILINTCTVKSATENKIASRIDRIAISGKLLVIAGCMTADSKRLRKIAPRAVLLGTASLGHISEAIEAALERRPLVFKSLERKDELRRLFTAPVLRIPICEGCTSNCHFCQTKIARPGLRSYAPKTIIRWIEEGVAKGAKEVQLTAMDSGVYGLGLKPKIDLSELLGHVNSVDGDFLVRIGMINPGHVKRLGARLIDALKLPKFYKFLHIPVQTGSEKVCREMGRDHTVKDFHDAVRLCRNEIPEILISTDIIVGYPTETKADFEETLALVGGADGLKGARGPDGLDIVNVSKFSARPGTKAKELKCLPTGEVKRRSEIMAKAVRAASLERNLGFIGKEYEVLITEKQKDYTGRNINYKQVVVKEFRGKIGERVLVEIIDANYGALFGKITRR